jgi:signal transduction histidine kinase
MSPRGRLFRKYLVLITALVVGALLVSGLSAAYFAYQENKRALASLQREKALAAASKIEQFVKEIERQIAWTALPLLITGEAALEQRRLDYLKLLRQAPAITDVVQLDSDAREQLRVSRLAMDVRKSGQDFSGSPAFRAAKPGKPYFSPVYFRKETEPYLTIAAAWSGEEPGVTVAEVNLKFIWDVVSQIRIGEKGHAYVVDSSGQLIAHPDISRVLQKTNLSDLPQVRAARNSRAVSGQGEALIAEDRAGNKVLTAYAGIATLGWFVFVEQPLAEAFAPLYSFITHTGLLLGLGLALSVLASFFLARTMVRPIRELGQGAEKFGVGELDHRIDVRTNDELKTLAQQFNSMAEKLEESYASLERKVEERTAELKESLEHQTATNEILRVISGSLNDSGPVFETIVTNAARLCEANFAVVLLYQGERLSSAAHTSITPDFAQYFERGYPVNRETATGRAALERIPVQVLDILADPDFVVTSAHRSEGVRTVLAVPMLRDDTLLGVIATWRHEVRPFSDKQIKLLETFADQAVIAIENVRLFQELQERTGELARSVEDLRALGEVSKVVSSSLNVERVLRTVAGYAVNLSNSDGCGILEFNADRGAFVVVASHNLSRKFVDTIERSPIDPRRGAIARATSSAQPVQVADIANADDINFREAILQQGFQSLLAVPMGTENVTRGIVVFRRVSGVFDDRVLNLMTALASQSKVAIENAGLFREIEDKSRQLEIANRHKSEFLANMSHELRTPLNAIIGFSEVLDQRLFGELNPKQAEYVKDIHASGHHLLSLINDILDLSKIEAGRMELQVSEFNLPVALENALTLVHERANRRGVCLELELQNGVGNVTADERKVKQILLNLLSNAIKFTPERGKVSVSAKRNGEAVEITVADTGIGIATEDQEIIFEEFRQLSPERGQKREGTGLGLALARKFVEMHGGRIWVESALGTGATFTFTLPNRTWPTN